MSGPNLGINSNPFGRAQPQHVMEVAQLNNLVSKLKIHEESMKNANMLALNILLCFPRQYDKTISLNWL